MLFFSGFELLGVGWSLNLPSEDSNVLDAKEMRGRWNVMAITMGLVIALKNDFIALIGGWFAWGLYTRTMKMPGIRGQIRLS